MKSFPLMGDGTRGRAPKARPKILEFRTTQRGTAPKRYFLNNKRVSQDLYDFWNAQVVHSDCYVTIEKNGLIIQTKQGRLY